MDKTKLRTQKAVIWWSWWDEAEHKSTTEKRIAFYDALFRYVFLGEIPPDPKEMENPKGEDWAAYDATHYFDIIDSNIGNFIDLDGTVKRKRGGQKGNSNARKNKADAENENESQNESENECETNKTNPFIRIKKEERRIKNEEERESEEETNNALALETKNQNESPTLDEVLAVAKDVSHRASCEAIPEDFAREWFDLMETSGWRDTKGRQVVANGWRGKLAFAWRDEKRRRQEAKAARRKGEPSNIHHDETAEVGNAF